MGAAIDPSGFQISAVIRTTDGYSATLWMRGASDGGGGLAGAVGDALGGAASSVGGMLGGGGSGPAPEFVSMDLPYLESVDVDISLGLSCRVTVAIATPFDIGLKLLDTSLFQIGNVIEVQNGYPKSSRFTPWVTAMMSKPSIRISGDEGLTLTINGDGGGFASLRGTSSKVYTGKSHKQIIKEIADRHKWVTEFPEAGLDLASVVSAVTGGGENEDPLDKTRESVGQENMTDWFFVQRLVRSDGCDAFLASNEDGKRTLFVKRRKDALKQQPSVRLLMRGNPNFEKDFPILDFESEAEGVWLPGAAVSVKSRDIDPDDGSTTDIEATADSTKEPSLGDAGVPGDGTVDVNGEKVQLVASGGGDERAGEYLSTSARDPRGQQSIAQSHRDESTLRGGFNAQITTYGLPDLWPGDLVEVQGLGIFNSNYYITELGWSANASEFLSKLKVINNASASGLIDDVFLNDPPSTNTEHVDAGLEADSGGGLLAQAKDVSGL